jgi:hypothetical protein
MSILRKQIPTLLNQLKGGANTFKDYSIRSYINRRVDEEFAKI